MWWLGIILIGAGLYLFLKESYAWAQEGRGTMTRELPVTSPADMLSIKKERYTKEDVKKAIKMAAKMFDLDPDFLAAIAMVESNFNPYAVDPRGISYGFAQMTLSTARWLGFKGKKED